MSDLRPCPFCGSPQPRYQLAYGIRCTACDASVPCRGDDYGPWNRRAEAAAALAEAQAEIARLEAVIAQEAEMLAVVQAKKHDYEIALGSIARNTCCEGCQEAARVARAALSPGKREGV